ncbi:alpha/beta fold hydrolase [Antrihabitans spumae]|jgi:pimeloyl-ACP methyl ester carboxylesterase|uniref:Alpha/beta fold hydrolase n=1 Tax=Antrihabitans spumae TaxID=3373370 RepID=A0ABW7KRQ1_9NOCA
MDLAKSLGAERILRLPQGPVKIYERGSGPPIVFVHGLFVNAAAWRKVVPRLSEKYRCITADWPFGGHQEPMNPDADLTPTGIADTIADVLDHLGLQNVTLVGNDGGGMLSQLVVTRRPRRLARLVLTPCDTYENFPPPLFDYLCWMARTPGAGALTRRILRIPQARYVYARSRIGYGSLTVDPIDTELIDHYLFGITHSADVMRDSLKFLRAVNNRYTLDAAAQFSSVSVPVLIAWAPEDKIFPYSEAQRLAADFPTSQSEAIHGSRTWVAEDQPDRTALLIDEFVQRTIGTEQRSGR